MQRRRPKTPGCSQTRVGGRAGALLGWVGFVVGGWAGEWVGGCTADALRGVWVVSWVGGRQRGRGRV